MKTQKFSYNTLLLKGAKSCVLNFVLPCGPTGNEKILIILLFVVVSTVTKEYNIHEFVRMADDLRSDSSEHGVLYGFISSFDVDGSMDNVLSGKWYEPG